MTKYNNCYCSGVATINGRLRRKGACGTSYTCNKFGNNCKFGSNISNLDKDLLPKKLVNSNGNLKSLKDILYYVQNPANKKILFQIYNFYQSLKFAYNLCGNNRSGCCYKMLWKTAGNKQYLNFNEKVDLYRFLIRNNTTSQLYRFIKITLGFLQKANVAKNMISKNKYYPYQNLVYYNPYKPTKVWNPKSKKCCYNFNKIGKSQLYETN